MHFNPLSFSFFKSRFFWAYSTKCDCRFRKNVLCRNTHLEVISIHDLSLSLSHDLSSLTASISKLYLECYQLICFSLSGSSQKQFLTHLLFLLLWRSFSTQQLNLPLYINADKVSPSIKLWFLMFLQLTLYKN